MGQPSTTAGFHFAWFAGLAGAAPTGIAVFAGIGVTRVMLQHLVHADLAMVELIGELNSRLARTS